MLQYSVVHQFGILLSEPFTCWKMVKIGNGNSKFWYDLWALKEKLCSGVLFVAIQDTELRIKDVWQDGRWHLDRL
jgi:hypothetical protein